MTRWIMRTEPSKRSQQHNFWEVLLSKAFSIDGGLPWAIRKRRTTDDE
jgi:hypothetical protein